MFRWASWLVPIAFALASPAVARAADPEPITLGLTLAGSGDNLGHDAAALPHVRRRAVVAGVVSAAG
jgi:hypothetical protein